ncbi:MAG: sugar ABC transporter permease [Spirochaetaceae bacterium]|jgi:multiple sugar transport system permease protein|nr:sugar ABC transporter permease [Spirochaetaceae bacterium]
MLKKNRPLIITFLAPAVLCYLIVFLYPTIRTMVMSLFYVESVSSSVAQWEFAGFANYVKLFNTPMFKTSMFNILRIWGAGGLVSLGLALVFAVILTNIGKNNCTKFMRSVIYLPNVVSAVAMGTMWLNFVYNSDYGFLHTLLQGLGFTKAATTLWTAPGNLFWAMLWAYCFGMVGYHMLIFMSGIEQIPTDFFEAAYIAGANGFQRFFYITLPNLKGVIRTNIVMWTVYTVGFFVWGQLFSPVNLSNDTVAPMNYMYELVFGASSSAKTARDAGAGAGIGVILMLIVIVVFTVTNFITKNDDTEL